jgi:very-short-patch-repair endonuclease
MSPKADALRRQSFKRGFAKALRENPTEAERRLWLLLRRRQLGALRFRRQQTIGPYVVAFFCPSARLIVELDGSQHGSDVARSHDDSRTAFLEARRFRVLRFWNGELLKDPDAVLDAIWQTAQI